MRKLLKRVLITLAILLPPGLIYAGFKLYDGIDDAYAQWGAADLVIAYMRDHDGEWPSDWNALEPYFFRKGCRVSGWSYDRFQSRIFIDFTADFAKLRQASYQSSKPPFDVIHATSIWGAQFEGGPNEQLFYYFYESKIPEEV